MKRHSILYISLGGTLLLSACAGTQLNEAEKISPSGTQFDTNLYEGYVKLARAEYGEGDYKDSDVFAGRAIASGSGEDVMPEALEARALPDDAAGALAAARSELVAALDGGAGARMPMEAADAQVKFDCWMQEQEENFQPDDIAACRAGFEAAVAKLKVTKMVAEPAPKPEPMPLPGPFVVYFDFDKADLTTDAMAVLAKLLNAAADSKYEAIVALGHADRAGMDDYNQKLSEMRVKTVASYLANSGLDNAKIRTSAFGEKKPAIETGDDQSEPKNRRVEILFSK